MFFRTPVDRVATRENGLRYKLGMGVLNVLCAMGLGSWVTVFTIVVTLYAINGRKSPPSVSTHKEAAPVVANQATLVSIPKNDDLVE